MSTVVVAKRVMWQFLLWIDQGFNVVTGGWADETFSARCWRLQYRKNSFRITRKIVDKIFFFSENHCYKSYLAEKERKHLPPEYRND